MHSLLTFIPSSNRPWDIAVTKESWGSYFLLRYSVITGLRIITSIAKEETYLSTHNPAPTMRFLQRIFTSVYARGRDRGAATAGRERGAVLAQVPIDTLTSRMRLR